ncbi:MAG TPA: efflux RND transporter periplasmic adaptor subunit [Xanthobacteraceae bacterium]|nr:efflux RND transporter periplasmic adaptor subunit [Xanthobacteraceae bacterium]
MTKAMIIRRGLQVALLAFTLASCTDAQTKEPAAVSVGVVTAERRAVEKTLDFVGRIEAINRVEVRARVSGYLEAVLFKEGDVVKEGDPLYRIESGLFQAAVEQAQGALERSKASKILSEQQLQRAEELLARNTGTPAARDQAVASHQQAIGAVMIDEANLATAKINLGYTNIVAPVGGKVGKTNITKGNSVSTDGVLTVIVSKDPMYVTFPVSQRDFLRARAGGPQLDGDGAKARLRFADGSVYPQTGRINFVDVTVDRSTDTVLVRATFPNPGGALVDGQLVRVNLETGVSQQKVVIPQAALIADQEGSYVFVVEDGKAAVKRIKADGESGTEAVVAEGLSGGEQVIVEGVQNLRPGAPVRPSARVKTADRS